MFRIIFINIIFTAYFLSQGYAQAISFTKEDRDILNRIEKWLTLVEERLTRVESDLVQLKENQILITAYLKALEKQMDNFRLDTQHGFDRLYNLFFWGFGLFFGVIAILIGYFIYGKRINVL
ncbi:MAG: hypothetical protein FVQ77_09750 [Cytophagales bacterium]|nr:hypothetical protein [Cytophagales bacterium]